MHKNNIETKKFRKTQVQPLEMPRSYGEMRGKSKSLGDLVSLRKDIDKKLNGKHQRLSARPARARRLGATTSAVGTKANASLETRNSDTTQPDVYSTQANHRYPALKTFSVQKRKSFTPPPSPENGPRLQKIVEENGAHLSQQELKKLRLGDILETASILEVTSLKRTSSSVCRRLCNHVLLKSDRTAGHEFCTGQFRPTDKQRLVVHMPRVGEIADAEEGYSECHFSYRHKK